MSDHKSIKFQRMWRKFKIYLIFVVAVIAFGIMGLFQGGSSFSGSGAAAVVNDQVISMLEFDRQFQQEQGQMGGFLNNLPQAQRDMYLGGIRQRALQQLISREVFFQSARDLGLAAAEEDVIDQIVKINAFHSNGQFDRVTYESVLRANKLQVNKFESGVENQVRAEKLQNIFKSAFVPMPIEKELDYQLKNSKLNLSFVAVNKSLLQDKNKTTKKDVAKYLKSNLDKVTKYYESNKAEFTAKKEVHARHILIKASDDKSFKAALDKAVDLKKQLATADFAELAKKHSADKGSAIKGGDLGFFERGKMVPAFEDMAFTLEKGQVSEPVKTQFGYHIIKVEDKRGGEAKSFDVVKSEVAEKLYKKSFSEDVMKELKGIYEAGKDKKIASHLSQFLKKYNLKFEETGEFDFSQAKIPKIGDDERFIDEALPLKKGDYFTKLITSDGKSYIVQVKAFSLASKMKPDAVVASNFRFGESLNKYIEAQEKQFKIKKNASILSAQQ
ncbi:MAG: hypothetical protein HOO06_06390 [Bdellovibrionaceae bacterium]|jgi:peptidyl-prolyl cis-trans isomerase D|nr:hypothetical protein [Pseudobdellovibrionaceae bacterium]